MPEVRCAILKICVARVHYFLQKSHATKGVWLSIAMPLAFHCKAAAFSVECRCLSIAMPQSFHCNAAALFLKSVWGCEIKKLEAHFCGLRVVF